jgi:MFS family permease
MASATFITVYAVSALSLSRSEVLLVGVVSGIMECIGCVIGATLADRIGRRPVLLIAHVCGAALSLVLFPIINGATVTLFAVVTWTLFLVCGINYGPMGSFLPELFQTRYRYTGAGISYTFGTLIGGAIVPIVATTLAGDYGSYSVGILLSGLSLTALLCTLALRETRNSDLDRVDVKS